jgi:hypothetical protein
MFYTRVGIIVAFLAIVVGISQITMGLLIATETIGPYQSALARYLPNSPSSGPAIDAGILKVIFAVALGILVEIRYAVRDKNWNQ